MPQKLTVLIPCKNERRNIRPCIEAARLVADEVLVADSGSTDGTLQIARELGVRVIEREYVNPSDFKNWAIPQAAHAWVLIVDADERVTPGLAAEIREVLASEADRFDAFSIPRSNYFLGHRIRYSGWQHSRVTRLMRRDLCRYDLRRVHEHLLVPPGRLGQIEQPFLHYTVWSFDQYFAKNMRYTEWGALDLADRGGRPNVRNLLVRPVVRFLRHYVLKRGFLDGKAGLILSLMAAYSVFTKYARLWALENGLPQPDPEAEREQNRDAA